MVAEATPEVTAPLTDEQLQASFPGQDLEHIKSMMGRADGEGKVISPNADDDDGTITYPDYIPEKYRNGTLEEAHAAMAKGYTELEGKLGGTQTGKQDSQQAAAEDADSTDGTKGDDDDGETGKLSLAEVEAAYIANDKVISEEVYAQYEEQGMPRATLDAYITGQQMIANQMVTSVHEVAGGPEQYKAMTDWAETNWSDDEVAAFDTVVTAGDKAAAIIAARGLKAAYAHAVGQDPSLVTGDGGKVNTGARYESRAQMTSDMKDPRYKTDPAFRKTVEEKVGNSDIW